MKRYYKPTTLLLCTMLTGCFKQLPASISYNDATTRMIDAEGKVEGEVSISTLQVPTDQPVAQQAISPQLSDQPVGYLQQSQQQEIDDEELDISYYEVVQGDTLQSIAAQHGISVEVLAYANNFSVGYIPQEMELLKIPSPTAKIPPKPASNLDAELNSLGAIGSVREEQGYNVMPEKLEQPAPAQQLQASKFIAPVRGHIITKFGQATPNGKSNGINITAPKGTPIYTSASGRVVYSGFDAKFGNLVIIQLLDNKVFVAYAHMDNLIVKKGQDIMQGEILGHVGATGEVQHPQLHFAIRRDKKPVDPLQFVKIVN